jgi:hypothetical protein
LLCPDNVVLQRDFAIAASPTISGSLTALHGTSTNMALPITSLIAAKTFKIAGGKS